MTFNFMMLVFGIVCLMFLAISFMVKKKFLIYAIIMNIIFFTGNYYVISSLLGVPKPIYEGIPLFDTRYWPDKGLELKSVFTTDGKETFIVLVGDDDKPILYAINYDPKLIEEIKKALKKAEGSDSKVYIGRKPSDKKESGAGASGETDYGDANTAGHGNVTVVQPPELPPKVDNYIYGGSNEENHHAE